MSEESGELIIGISVEKAFEIFASEYPTLIRAVLEGVQNSLDALASKVVVTVNLDNQSVTVEDDGRGCTYEEMTKKIGKFGHSSKGGPKDLGKHGIGILAFYKKCESLSLTSHTGKADQSFQHQYHLSKPTELSSGKFKIPEEKISRPKEQWWTTRLYAEGIYSHHRMNELVKKLPEAIMSAQAIKMEETGARVQIVEVKGRKASKPIEVVPKKGFDGKRIPGNSFTSKMGVTIGLELYVAQNREGVLYFREGIDQVNRYPLSGILETASKEGMFDTDVYRLLSSGHLEGYVFSDTAKTHVNRSELERSMEATKFLVTLKEWFDTEGRQYIDTAKEQDKNKVQDDLLQKVVSNIMNESSSWLAKYAESIQLPGKHGGVKRQPVAFDDDKPNRGGGGGTYGGGGGGGENRVNTQPKFRLVTYNTGDGDQHQGGRTIKVAYSEMPGSSARHEFRKEEQTLYLNRRHRDFRVREDDTSSLEKYIQIVLSLALGAQLLGEVVKESYSQYEDLLIAINAPACQSR